MYERIRDELSLGFGNVTDKETTLKLLEVCDVIFSKYDFVVKEVGLTPYNFETPVIVETYLQCLALKGCSEQTVKNRRYSLNDMFKVIGKSPSQIETNDIRTYLYYLKNTKGTSEATLNQYLTQINSFFKWCSEDGYCESNPCSKIQRFICEKKQRHALTDNEFNKIVSSCDNLKEKAILMVMYSTGCRVSELINIKKSDIDWMQNEQGEYDVHLFGKGKKHRTSFLTQEAVDLVNEYLATRSDDSPYLFISQYGEKYERFAINRICDKLKDKSDVTTDFTPHIVRHTSATHALNNGMLLDEVQDFLGHESPNTTRVYAEMNKERLKSSHRKAFA